MRRSRSCITSWVSPRNKRWALSTSRACWASEVWPTQGPEQRRIWYSKQGRERLLNTVSSQVRRRNTFWISSMASRTAHTLG